MTTFADRRLLRLRSYTGGLAPAAPAGVAVGTDIAERPAGQAALLTAINLLARAHPSVYLQAPDAPLLVPSPLEGSSLHEACERIVTGIDPENRFEPTTTIPAGVPSLGIGGDCGPAHVYCAGQRWTCRVSSSPVRTNADPSSLLGLGLAVVVAAGMVFRIALDLPIEPDVSLSLWTFESTDRPTGPTALERLDLGRVWLVGAGAVGSCLAWWLMFVGIDGHWTVIDLDVVKALNLDRSLPFFASHTSDFGVRACSKADIVSSILVGSDAFPHAWDDWTRTDPHSPDVLFLAANEGGVRPSVAAYSHPATLGATTSPHWTAELHRHLIGRDGCATCRFPEKAPKFECATSAVAGTPPPGPALPTDASLPFLAGGAGLLGLAGLLQLNEGRFVSHDANHWTLAFDPADDLMRMRRWPHWPSCHAIADPSIRRALHGATRYQALDPEL